MFGPLVVCIGLAAALLLNFGFKVRPARVHYNTRQLLTYVLQYKAALDEARRTGYPGVVDYLMNTTTLEPLFTVQGNA
jgi:hypothetical protein